MSSFAVSRAASAVSEGAEVPEQSSTISPSTMETPSGLRMIGMPLRLSLVIEAPTGLPQRPVNTLQSHPAVACNACEMLREISSGNSRPAP